MTDALETGEAADCALLVVRQDAASRVSVISSLAALDSFGVPVLGYALNVCTGRGRGQSGYGYGGYGGYSYGYGYGYGRNYSNANTDSTGEVVVGGGYEEITVDVTLEELP